MPRVSPWWASSPTQDGPENSTCAATANRRHLHLPPSSCRRDSHVSGVIKDRASRAAGETYLSNGACVQCDALFGYFFLYHEELLEVLVTEGVGGLEVLATVMAPMSGWQKIQEPDRIREPILGGDFSPLPESPLAAPSLRFAGLHRAELHKGETWAEYALGVRTQFRPCDQTAMSLSRLTRLSWSQSE